MAGRRSTRTGRRVLLAVAAAVILVGVVIVATVPRGEPEASVAVDTAGGIHYPVGDLFDYNGPTLLVSRLLYKPEYSVEHTLAAYDAVLDAVRQQGIERSRLVVSSDPDAIGIESRTTQ